jgi:ATP-dependent Clp protease ATP-binding subunit ClpA
MFERFTDRARGVLVAAGELAKENKSPFIRRHHVLIGLLDTSDEGSDVVATILERAEVDPADLRAKLVASLTASEEPVAEAGGKIPFTAETKKALELSLREALSLGHNYIGRAHLLLGVLRDPDGPLAEVLGTTRLTHELAREIIVAEVPPVGRRRRTGYPRFGRGPMGGGRRATTGLQAVFQRAEERAAKQRVINTGDLLVALLETPGTHFAAALSSVSLPDLATVRAEVDRLLAAGVIDGTEHAVEVNPQSGSVTINDPQIAAELKRLVGEGDVTPDALREILRRLQSGE